MLVKAKCLKLGDTIKVFEGAFGTAVVTQVNDKGVHLFRPYAVTSDFAYTGGVIPYTGTELWIIPANEEEYERYRSVPIR